MKNGKRIYLPESNKDDTKHTHEDGTTHSHEGGDQSHHHHEDGTAHDHEGGDQPHTHDDDVYMYEDVEQVELPNFQKMTKKALGEWAEENDISVDSKKTKAKMIEEIKEQL